VSGFYTDSGVLDSHIAIWDWGDSTKTNGIVDENADKVTGLHLYAVPGVYIVKLTVTDDDMASDTAVFEYVVIYDANGGFATGAGIIDSPAGAYIPDATLTGKANFGFISKYQKGKSVPEGNSHFLFHAANMNFFSTSYDWLVVAGSKVQLKGSGTINHDGNYGFLLTATDGGTKDSDKFRIKIWNKETNSIVYDNQKGDSDIAEPATIIESGNIVIHK